MARYEALVVVSFGGPEAPDDVMPFLENVTRGRDVPAQRLQAVAKHYMHFGGVSPINSQNRELVAALEAELDLPVYLGNRNWHPLLGDTVGQMAADGIGRALAFVTSAFGSWSSCRQYLDDIEGAVSSVAAAPAIDKLRLFWNHPRFLAAVSDRVAEASPADHDRLIFTAHSIPADMAANCDYEAQLQTSAALVAERFGLPWELAYQSRSGLPSVPWLGPDIGDALRSSSGAAVVVPIGFVSDHMEVVWDLDVEAAAVASDAGVTMTRAGTVGTHPEFVAMIAELVAERQHGAAPRAIGPAGPWPHTCPATCCLASS